MVLLKDFIEENDSIMKLYGLNPKRLADWRTLVYMHVRFRELMIWVNQD